MKSLVWQALKFTVFFLAIGGAAFALLSVPAAEGALASVSAYSSHALLTLFGVGSSIAWEENPHLLSERFDAELVELCWGKLELAVLLGVIFASIDRSLRKRLWGAVLGASFLLLFNAFRIAVTLLLFDPAKPFLSSVFHDVFFRVSLVIVLVGYYAAWYYWLSRK